MNVKIAEDSVTFKITEEELNHLLDGSALEKKVLMGHTAFVMVIDPNPHKYFEDSAASPLKLVLDRAESCLMLRTTQEEIRKLADMGKNRDGLSAHTDGIDVFLQVDIRKDSRPKKQRTV